MHVYLFTPGASANGSSPAVSVNIVVVSQGKLHCNYDYAPENADTCIIDICVYVYLTVRGGGET